MTSCVMLGNSAKAFAFHTETLAHPSLLLLLSQELGSGVSLDAHQEMNGQ